MVVVFVVQGSGVCGQFCLVVVDHKLADRPSVKTNLIVSRKFGEENLELIF